MTGCVLCRKPSERVVPAYWDGRPRCPVCCVRLVEFYDRNGEWPADPGVNASGYPNVRSSKMNRSAPVSAGADPNTGTPDREAPR